MRRWWGRDYIVPIDKGIFLHQFDGPIHVFACWRVQDILETLLVKDLAFHSQQEDDKKDCEDCHGHETGLRDDEALEA
jgi:hypothetical protein